jgi:hypothetical protein
MLPSGQTVTSVGEGVNAAMRRISVLVLLRLYPSEQQSMQVVAGATPASSSALGSAIAAAFVPASGAAGAVVAVVAGLDAALSGLTGTSALARAAGVVTSIMTVSDALRAGGASGVLPGVATASSDVAAAPGVGPHALHCNASATQTIAEAAQGNADRSQVWLAFSRLLESLAVKVGIYVRLHRCHDEL